MGDGRPAPRSGAHSLGLALALAAVLGMAVASGGACRRSRAWAGTSRAPSHLVIVVGGQRFDVGLALDPTSRRRGLGGREALPPDAGMLFAVPAPRPLATVMRDCPFPLDVAFLDASGRVVALYTMQPEPPRRPDETEAEYEARLPRYPSRHPVQFVLETAAGRLRAAGLRVGAKLPLDLGPIARRAVD